MKLFLPDKNLLQTTSDIDYFHWNYQFPIKYIQKFRFEAILSLIGDKIYDKMLEIGTGSGIFLPELAQHCNELYACDVHDKMHAVRRVCELTKINVHLARCSMDKTVFRNDFFDAIVAVSVLEFVDNLEKSLKEVKRILRTNGIFFTICPQQNSLLDFVLSLFTRKDPSEEFRQSRTQVSLMLEKHFSVVEKRIFPPVLGRVLPVYYYYKLVS